MDIGYGDVIDFLLVPGVGMEGLEILDRSRQLSVGLMVCCVTQHHRDYRTTYQTNSVDVL